MRVAYCAGLLLSCLLAPARAEETVIVTATRLNTNAGANAAVQSGVVVRREEPAAAAKPIVVAPVREKKSAPLKNLGSLDKLFPR